MGFLYLAEHRLLIVVGLVYVGMRTLILGLVVMDRLGHKASELSQEPDRKYKF
jgi:hypothetical protein